MVPTAVWVVLVIAVAVAVPTSHATNNWHPLAPSDAAHLSPPSESSDATGMTYFASQNTLPYEAIALLRVDCGGTAGNPALPASDNCGAGPKWWASRTDASPQAGGDNDAAWDGTALSEAEVARRRLLADPSISTEGVSTDGPRRLQSASGGQLPVGCSFTHYARVVLPPFGSLYVGVQRGSDVASGAGAGNTASFYIDLQLVPSVDVNIESNADGVVQFGGAAATADGLIIAENKATNNTNITVGAMMSPGNRLIHVAIIGEGPWRILLGSADDNAHPTSGHNSLVIAGSGPATRDIAIEAAFGQCTIIGQDVFVLRFEATSEHSLLLIQENKGFQGVFTRVNPPLGLRYNPTPIDALPGRVVLAIAQDQAQDACTASDVTVYSNGNIVEKRVAGSSPAGEWLVECSDGTPGPVGAWTFVVAAPPALSTASHTNGDGITFMLAPLASALRPVFRVYATRLISLDAHASLEIPDARSRGQASIVPFEVVSPADYLHDGVPAVLRIVSTAVGHLLQGTPSSQVAWMGAGYGTYSRSLSMTGPHNPLYLSSIGPMFSPSTNFSSFYFSVQPSETFDSNFSIASEPYRLFSVGSMKGVALPAQLSPLFMRESVVQIEATASAGGTVDMEWWVEGDFDHPNAVPSGQPLLMKVTANPVASEDGVLSIGLENRLFIHLGGDAATITASSVLFMTANTAFADPSFSVMPLLGSCFAIPVTTLLIGDIDSPKSLLLGITSPLSGLLVDIDISVSFAAGMDTQSVRPSSCPGSTGTRVHIQSDHNAAVVMPSMQQTGILFMSLLTTKSSQIPVGQVYVSGRHSTFPLQSPTLACRYSPSDGLLYVIPGSPVESVWEITILPATPQAADAVSTDPAKLQDIVVAASPLATFGDGSSSTSFLVSGSQRVMAQESASNPSEMVLAIQQQANEPLFLSVSNCAGDMDLALVTRNIANYAGSLPPPPPASKVLTFGTTSEPMTAGAGTEVGRFSFVVDPAATCVGGPLRVVLQGAPGVSGCTADAAVVWIDDVTADGLPLGLPPQPYYACDFTTLPFTAQHGQVVVQALEDMTSVTLVVECPADGSESGSGSGVPEPDKPDNAALIVTSIASTSAFVVLGVLALRHLHRRNELPCTRTQKKKYEPLDVE